MTVRIVKSEEAILCLHIMDAMVLLVKWSKREVGRSCRSHNAVETGNIGDRLPSSIHGFMDEVNSSDVLCQ